jgi:yecA family protein
MMQLKTYLDRPSRASHLLGYHELQGFIFGIVLAPFAVETKQWTRLMLPHMDDEIYDEFCDLYHHIERSVLDGTPALPADCPLAPDPLRNLDPGAPLSQWSRGFFQAQQFFAKEWARFMIECMKGGDKEALRAFSRALVHLNFFASRETIELTVQESKPRTIAEIAAEGCASFETDMAVCAMFLRPWRERAARVGPERRPAKSPGTSGPKTHLKAFLARPSNPPGVFSYHALQGFMFAVASAPRLVEPHEWLALVLGDAIHALLEGAESQPVIDELRDLYLEIDARAARGAVALPPDCPMAPEPMANLDPASPLSQWSRGMYAAHDWLANDWMRILALLLKEDRRMATEVGRATMHLLFFASSAVAEGICKQWGEGSLEELAAQAHRDFEIGMVVYAEIGRRFRARPRHDSHPEARFASSGVTQAPTRSKAVGRNEPCPCGSGKKYKKCCGGVH